MSPLQNEKKLNEYVRKTDILEIMVYGRDGDNGIKGAVTELENFVDKLKPQLVELIRVNAQLEEIKKNIIKLAWVIIAAVIIALGSRYIQFKLEDRHIKEEMGVSNDIKNKTP